MSENAASGSRIDALESRIALLEDHRLIHALLADYAFAADTRDVDGWVDLWTDDGVYDLGEDNVSTYQGSFVGHEALRGLLAGSGMPPRHRSQHYVNGPVRIELSGDTAVVDGYSFTLVQDDAGVVMPWAVGFSRWELRRVEGRWRIARRSRRELGSDPREVVGT